MTVREALAMLKRMKPHAILVRPFDGDRSMEEEVFKVAELHACFLHRVRVRPGMSPSAEWDAISSDNATGDGIPAVVLR